MNISDNTYSKLNFTWWMLKLTFGLVFIIAGADKFTNIIVQWVQYLNGMYPTAIGTDALTFMHAVGVIEIVIGVITLSRWTKLGAYLTAMWLLLIVINLVTKMAFFDVAVRDVGLAVGALALAFLTTIREEIQRS